MYMYMYDFACEYTCDPVLKIGLHLELLNGDLHNVCNLVYGDTRNIRIT